MTALYFGLGLALVLLHLAALTAVVARVVPPAIARVLGIVGVVLPLFALEHFIGLGSLQLLWPLTTALSLWVLSRAGLRSREWWRAEAVFLACIVYALAWRWVDSNLDPVGEAMTDLYFVSNYLAGETLPPPDRWLGGAQPFDFYYGFQHYAAALLGRLFGFSPGLTVTLAMSLAIALIGSLAWYLASVWIERFWPKLLIVATLLVGGTGLSPVLLVAIDQPRDTAAERAAASFDQMWASTRFSGLYEDRVSSAWLELAPGQIAMDLPFETPAYLALQGDFHPPLGGWVILMLSLALMAWIERTRAPPWATGALAATPVLALVTNAWVFPWQAALVFLWGVRAALVRTLEWRAALAGAALALALVYPFLGHFSAQALSPVLLPVPEAMRTRPLVWIGLYWPIVVLLAMAAVVAARQRAAAGAIWLVIGFVLAGLVFLELFFFDDPNGGAYERFNTVLKGSGWIWPLALMALAPRIWGEGGPYLRAALVGVCGLLLTNAWNVASYWRNAEVPGGSQFVGDGWLRVDPAHDELLRQLTSAPPGVVLEYVQGGAYDAGSAFALFAGKPAALGWSSHLEGWRGGSIKVAREARAMDDFFRGEWSGSLAWLEASDIRYIVWSRREESTLPGVRAKIDALIGSRYVFRSTELQGERRIGYWERRP